MHQKKKALEEGARIMAVTYFLKDQKFHFPACSEELPAAAHKQKIPLTHQKALWSVLVFNPVDFTCILFFFLFLIPIFSLCYFVGYFRLPGVWLFFIMTLYSQGHFTDSNIPSPHPFCGFCVSLQKHAFQGRSWADLSKYCCGFKPSWRWNTTKPLLKFPHLFPATPVEWEGEST